MTKSLKFLILNYHFYLFSLLFSLGTCAIAGSSRASFPSPTQAIKDLDQKTGQYRVGKSLNEKDRAFNHQLKSEILRGTFNLRELARLSLNKHWEERSARERNYFVELLTQLLETRSVFAKEKAEEKGSGHPYVIDYKQEKYLNAEKNLALVTTKIRLKKRRMVIALDYKLKKTPDGRWQIYDVIMDDASLIANYRSSFNQIITKYSYAELVQRMEKKLKEFQAKRI